MIALIYLKTCFYSENLSSCFIHASRYSPETIWLIFFDVFQNFPSHLQKAQIIGLFNLSYDENKFDTTSIYRSLLDKLFFKKKIFKNYRHNCRYRNVFLTIDHHILHIKRLVNVHLYKLRDNRFAFYKINY